MEQKALNIDVATLENVARSRASMGFKLFEAYELQREFCRLTTESDNLCLSGANRTGKTSAAGRWIIPIWATGDYPVDWQGRKWDRPVTIWVGSTDWTTNIDGCQRALLGDVHKGKEHAGVAYWDVTQGTFIAPGIPAEAIEKIEMNPHVKGAVSRVFIKNKSGGTSEIRFISYLQGRERLQAGKVDIVWMDEEPPEDINTELAARTIDSAGLSILTFTPLKGISNVVKAFIGDAQIDSKMPSVLKGSSGVLVRMSAYDVPHLGPDKIEAMKRRYPKHEWPARIHGIPALGQGAIYPFDDEFLTVQGFEIPDDWRVLDAVDFGVTHPTARARVVMNPENKDVFLVKTYKEGGLSPKMHALAWENQFEWNVPLIPPHDGANKETDNTTKIAKYQALGVKMPNTIARMPSQKGRIMPLEGSVQYLHDMMRDGSFKIFPGNHHFTSEKALYQRKRKKAKHSEDLDYGISEIVPVNDDCLDAVRYAVMSIRAGMGVLVDTAKREAGANKDAYGHWQDNSATYDDFDPFAL